MDGAQVLSVNGNISPLRYWTRHPLDHWCWLGILPATSHA
jgi:hypothetical protein